MSHDKAEVTLHVHKGIAPPNGGYSNVNAANGAEYYFKYTGGTDEKGNVSAKKGKKTVVTVALDDMDPTTSFRIGGAMETNDVNCNLTIEFDREGVTITDDGKDLTGLIYYQIFVLDITNKTYIVCDPTIQNVDR